MPAVIGWIISGVASGLMWLFKNRLGQMLTGILVWFGVSMASYKLGVEPFIEQVESMAQSGGGGGQFAATAMAWLGVLKFDVALTMIISAVAAKHAVNAGRVFFKRRAAG